MSPSTSKELLDAEMVTPEEAKGWKKLKSFKGKELSEKEARAARAKETLLDEVTDSIKRN